MKKIGVNKEIYVYTYGLVLLNKKLIDIHNDIYIMLYIAHFQDKGILKKSLFIANFSEG